MDGVKSKVSCPVLQTAHLLGKKWCIALLEEMALGGPKGYNELARVFPGITPTQLSRQLKEMGREGILSKTETRKGRSTLSRYALTQKGRELEELVKGVKRFEMKWGETDARCLERRCSTCSLFQRQEPGNSKSVPRRG